MRNYIIKRLLLIPLTLLGILTINFLIIQTAPGGPVEHTLAKYRGFNVDSKSQFTSTAAVNMNQSAAKYQGAQGVPEDLIKELENNSDLTNLCMNAFGKWSVLMPGLISAKAIIRINPSAV